MGQTVAPPSLICLVKAAKGPSCRDKAAVRLLHVSKGSWGWKERGTSAVLQRHMLQEQATSSSRECAAQEDMGPQVRTCRSTSLAWPVAGDSPAVTVCKEDVAAPCLDKACSTSTSHHSSTFETWPRGMQKYTPACVLPGTRVATAEQLLPDLPGARGWGAAMSTPLPPPQHCLGTLFCPPPSPAVGLPTPSPAPPSHTPKMSTHLPGIFTSC